MGDKDNIAKSVSYRQNEILGWILDLHVPDKKIECDVTYSKGVFYKNGDIAEPKYKFDIHPVRNDIVQSDCINLPIRDKTFNCVMYDPPFVVSHGKNSIIGNRFGSFPTPKKLWEFYKLSMIELTRILNDDGILIVKCQDLSQGGRNYSSHVEIMNLAVLNGLYPKDLFVLPSKQKLMSPHQLNQLHARKFHCYFWVFKRTTKGTVKYSGLNEEP